ncbi:bifunctional oligoribonuclease/PAP phosphatase NrnA [Patescibacteria group bacterium]
MNKKNNTFEEIWDAILKAKTIVIGMHKRPDLDTAASALALAKVLKTKGKDVTVLSIDNLGPISGLFDTTQIIIVDPAQFNFSGADLYIAPDVSEEYRVSNDTSFSAPVKKIRIDHHPDSTLWGDLNYVDPSSSSVAGIVFDMFSKVGVPIDSELATLLLAGMLGDTGFFQNSNTKVSDLETAVKLMKSGANLPKLVWDIKFHDGLELFKLQEVVFKNLKVDQDRKYGYSHVSLAEKKEFGMEPDYQHHTLADYIKTLDGVDFVFTTIELPTGKFKVSFRARTLGFDTTVFANPLGGGGHPAASAVELEAKTVDEAIKLVKDKIAEVLRY